MANKKIPHLNFVTIIIEKARENAVVRYILVLSAAITILRFPTDLLSKGYDFVSYKFLIPNRIYLNLSDWKIPLDKDGKIITAPQEIKAGNQMTLRFSLTQGNKEAPEISKILVNFPLDAEITSDHWGKWTWERTNTTSANQYSLECSFYRFTHGSDWNLPALYVTFKKTGLINFRYMIIGNRMEKVDRAFTINTIKNAKTMVSKVKQPSNAASASIVSANTVVSADSRVAFIDFNPTGNQVSPYKYSFDLPYETKRTQSEGN